MFKFSILAFLVINSVSASSSSVTETDHVGGISTSAEHLQNIRSFISEGHIRKLHGNEDEFCLATTPTTVLTEKAKQEARAVDDNLNAKDTIDFSEAPTFISEYEAACNEEGGFVYSITYSVGCSQFPPRNDTQYVANLPICFLGSICDAEEQQEIYQNLGGKCSDTKITSNGKYSGTKITSSGKIMGGNLFLAMGTLVIAAVMPIM
jgi:hypothetical protein